MHDNMKILFATDFSSSSKLALQTAELLVKVYDADLIMIHVLTQFWRYFIASEVHQKETFQRLKTWQDKINPRNKGDFDLHVNVGNAADQILQQAQIENPDLILIGGESVLTQEKFIIGTTAESIVRYTKYSVWLSRKTSLSRVICGVDGSQASAKALEEAISLCHRFLAELCILHAMEGAAFPWGMTEDELSEKELEYKNESIHAMEEFIKPYNLTGINVHFHYPWGRAAQVIIDYADDFDYDLIIIGATGKSLLRQVLMGSTAARILRNTPCSLLVVR